MRFLRPRSLTGLMLIGFALVSVPLLIAVITATAKVRRLADESTRLVHTSVDTTHNTQVLFQQIATMERSVRLYQVLKDGSMLTGYRQTRDQFLRTLGQLDKPDVDVRRSAHLTTLRTLQSKLDTVLLASKPPSDAEVATLLPLITQLLSATAALGEYTGAQIDSGLSQLQLATASTQQYLMGLSVVMILLTATLVAYFTRRLMQPIRQIDFAIN